LRQQQATEENFRKRRPAALPDTTRWNVCTLYMTALANM